MTNKVLRTLDHKMFRPLPIISGGVAQTVAAVMFPFQPLWEISEKHLIDLEDGDKLVIQENTPARWKDGDRVVVLVHGLVDHSRVPYMLRMTRKLVNDGFSVFRVNLRSCGPGFGLSERTYNAGQSEDLRKVLRWISRKAPKSPITQVGYSLGANITLKMAGEDAKTTTGNLDSVVGVSSPLFLTATAEKLKVGPGTLFNTFFTLKLRGLINKHHRRYPHLPKPKITFWTKIHEFDDLYTAPNAGFPDAHTYHDVSSCGHVVPEIAVPSFFLCSEDDPIVDSESYRTMKFPESADVVMTKTGGHVGFIGHGAPTADFQWMDSLVSAWIAKR